MESREAECETTGGTPCVSDTQQPATEVVNPSDGIDFPKEDADGCCSSNADEFDFEFAPLPPSTAAEADGDDIFDAGRMWPGYYYPVFARPHPDGQEKHMTSISSQQLEEPASTSHEAATEAPPEGEDYCVWVPKKSSSSATLEADHNTAWKSLSASAAESSRRWRLRDLMHTSGRSHSDGTEKFAFLVPLPHHHAQKNPRAASGAAAGGGASAAGSKIERAAPNSRRAHENERHKKGVTEMDIATAHRLFYTKNGGNGGGAGSGGQHQLHKQSYLPYRKDLVGYFSSGGAHGPHTRFLPF